MKKSYIKPEFDINEVDLQEILQNITVSGSANGDPIGSGTDTPPTEGDVNKSSLWDEDLNEDYL